MSSEILVVTTPTIPNYKIARTIGPVYGMTIRSRGVGGKFVAGIQSIFGGEITSYVSELENARRESLQRLMENARKMGANAVIATDFETSDILQSTAIVFSTYGTAVVVEAIGQQEVSVPSPTTTGVPTTPSPTTPGLCRFCNYQNDVNAKFCIKCGTKLQ